MSNDIKKMRVSIASSRLMLVVMAIFLWISCTSQEQKQDSKYTVSPELISDPHYDMGPEDRYSVPYHPITYGQEVKAPMPGLYYCYKLVDWDGDGLTDMLGLARRGGGLRFFKNIGTKEEPLFRSLQENLKLLPSGTFPRWFDIADMNEDGKLDIIGYEKVDPREYAIKQLNIYFNEGTPTDPEWNKVEITHPDQTSITFGGRIAISDWNGDGLQDIIFAKNDMSRILKNRKLGDEAKSTMERPEGYAGFKDPDLYDPYVGEVYWAKNISDNPGDPVFGELQRMHADGEPIENYVGQYPTAYDINKDGLTDLIIGTQKPGLKVYLNEGTKTEPKLTYAGNLQNENSEEIYSSFALRFEPAELDGDGQDEFVTAAYFGNQDRFLVYDHQGGEYRSNWKFKDYLRIQAHPDTPVYGAGNSTIDPVDWDGDGDTDLLLGSEPSFPTIAINSGSEENRVFEPAQRLKFVDGSPYETYSIETGDGSHWGPLEWYSDRLAPRARDWDGDGVLDLISGSMGRRLYFSKGRMVDGELRFERPVNFTLEGEKFVIPDRQFPAVLDYNQDGHMDLIVNDQTPRMGLYLGDGSTNLKDPIYFRHEDGSLLQPSDKWDRVQGNRMGMDIAEWNGDGIRDLIVYRFHLGIYLYPGIDDSTFGEAQELVPLFSHLAGPSVMDWDGDELPDLLIGGDERRMIEPSVPAHLVVYFGEKTLYPPNTQN